MAAKMATIVGDVTGLQLSTKGKLVSKYCNISKTPGRGSIHALRPRLYHGRGMNLRVRPRVNNHESRTNKNLT